MASPTTPSSMQGMVAVAKGKDLDLLGYLTWFSVPDEYIGIRKLKMTLAAHGLPPSLAPTDTRAINTFKRAVRELEGRVKNGVIVETTVAQVNETHEDCVYQVSRVTRDLDERVVDYPKAMRVIFNKQTEGITYNKLGEVANSDLMPMMDAITAHYDANAKRVTGSRVRKVVRNYIRSQPDEQRGVDGLSGENLRGKSGGIYFIPAKHEAQVEALSGFLNELYPGRAYLHAVPMANGDDERELVRRHHIANTRQEMIEAMAEVKSLLSSDRDRAPRSDVVSNQWARFHALKRRAADYANVLEDEQDEINEMGETLKRQLDKLLG